VKIQKSHKTINEDKRVCYARFSHFQSLLNSLTYTTYGIVDPAFDGLVYFINHHELPLIHNGIVYPVGSCFATGRIISKKMKGQQATYKFGSLDFIMFPEKVKLHHLLIL